jgi:hypothetical protein
MEQVQNGSQNLNNNIARHRLAAIDRYIDRVDHFTHVHASWNLTQNFWTTTETTLGSLKQITDYRSVVTGRF